MFSIIAKVEKKGSFMLKKRPFFAIIAVAS